MKDIKSYVIGFLTCACLFLIMGQTKADNQNGRYQISTTSSVKRGVAGDYLWIHETIMNTQSGEVISRDSYRQKPYYTRHK